MEETLRQVVVLRLVSVLLQVVFQLPPIVAFLHESNTLDHFLVGPTSRKAEWLQTQQSNDQQTRLDAYQTASLVFDDLFDSTKMCRGTST